MSNLMITIALLLTAGAVFFSQRASITNVRHVNTQLTSQSNTLRARTAQLEQRQEDLQRRLNESQDRLDRLRQEQAKVPAPTPEVIVPPDPARQGGWPANATYFYLPKTDLASVGYRLFEYDRLSDDAAALFGMTAEEREAVDAAYDELWRKFRGYEIERMERVEKPNQWDWKEAVSYRIPSLENEARALRASFESSLQQSLGGTRATLLLEAANDHITSKLDELGQDARIISFGQVHQRDDQTQLYYGVLTEGVNAIARLIQVPLDPNSQAAYYARLFGADVPIKDP